MGQGLSDMASLVSAADSEQYPRGLPILYLQGDSPFSDLELCERLLSIHKRFRAEYTFADGYPSGFAAEVLSSRCLPNLVELAARDDTASDSGTAGGIEREALFALIQKDMNAYDVETELAPIDMRVYRFSPTCDTKRNTLSAERLWAQGIRTASALAGILPTKPDLLRTLPAFLWVQVAEGCPQACSYCPYPALAGDVVGATAFMPVDRFRALMAMAQDLCDDLVVDMSLWGECSLHPDPFALAEAVLAHPRFSLIIETSGIGWKPGVAERITELGGSRVNWIVSLDDDDEAGYRAIRGDGRAEASDFALRMARAYPGRLHVQAVRMKDNEPRLEAFYRSWKKETKGVIIQKYDSFAKSLSNRSVADLSPLERYPCRHLARDMAVLLDGTVPLCKHALEKDPEHPGRLRYHQTAGNVFTDGLASIWDRLGQCYSQHIRAEYPKPCGQCDEYHTFNA